MDLRQSLDSVDSTDRLARILRPFLLTIMVALIGGYCWWLGMPILGGGVPRSLDQALGVGALLAFHAALHWFSQYLPRKWLLAYICVQNLLIAFMGISSGYKGILVLLSFPVISVMLMRFDSLRWAIWVGLLYIVFTTIFYILFYGPTAIASLIVSDVVTAILYIPYYGALFLQFRARRQAQDLLYRLDIAHRELANYAQQVEQLTLSAERTRMAREFHDTLAQGVAGTILQLEALNTYLELGNIDKSKQIALQAKNYAQSALTDSRHAIDDLRIVPDRSEAILEVIREEVDCYLSSTGIAYKLDLPPVLTLQSYVMEHILRCITESLSNIARHAQAHHVSIELKVTSNQLTLQIKDDGIGFAPLSEDHRGHYGLLGLRERAGLIGGTLNIESASGLGTTIWLQCPII